MGIMIIHISMSNHAQGGNPWFDIDFVAVSDGQEHVLFLISNKLQCSIKDSVN